ncbi:hypothetical protein GCM10011588_49380 [Nocardia jinanensis]|uniref:Uncharacterized protein n=1 Tax=Nocardia jinanensis TaxID=382504 RepID=A0A917RT90_9NOCA|nr:hypothetical protein GCM10011588_49380 [Nocardia jinanensis]
MIICCHGDNGAILLRESSDEIAATQPFNDRLTPEHVRAHLRGSASVSAGESAMVAAGSQVPVGNPERVQPAQ